MIDRPGNNLRFLARNTSTKAGAWMLVDFLDCHKDPQVHPFLDIRVHDTSLLSRKTEHKTTRSVAGPLALHSPAELRWAVSSSGGADRARAGALPWFSLFPPPHILHTKLCPNSRQEGTKSRGKKNLLWEYMSSFQLHFDIAATCTTLFLLRGKAWASVSPPIGKLVLIHSKTIFKAKFKRSLLDYKHTDTLQSLHAFS